MVIYSNHRNTKKMFLGKFNFARIICFLLSETPSHSWGLVLSEKKEKVSQAVYSTFSCFLTAVLSWPCCHAAVLHHDAWCAVSLLTLWTKANGFLLYITYIRHFVTTMRKVMNRLTQVLVGTSVVAYRVCCLPCSHSTTWLRPPTNINWLLILTFRKAFSRDVMEDKG